MGDGSGRNDGQHHAYGPQNSNRLLLPSHLVFKTKIRCSSYVCLGLSCHTYCQNVSTEYQSLYYIASYYKNLLQFQKGLNSGMDLILPQTVDRGFRTPRRNLHQRTSSSEQQNIVIICKEYGKCEYIKYSASVGNK
jgi:hypothetical protein